MATAKTFTITAAPGTDIWRKPPTTDVFNGIFSSTLVKFLSTHH